MTDKTRELSDSDYVLALIDETFASVPEIKRHHERMRAIAAKLASAALTAKPVPDGCVLVPKEPTGEMLDAGDITTRTWKAILAAAPTQAEQGKAV